MTTGVRLILLALVICGAIVGVKRWESHLVAQGDAKGAARVQALWDAQTARDNDARERQSIQDFQTAERIARDDSERTDRSRAAARAAVAAERGLRAEIERLNGRAEPYERSAAGLAACAREATVARELLAESTGRYRGLAEAADGIRDQVIGLQNFAVSVCHAGVTAEVTR